ncbi:MAG: hypothetical protein LBP33_10755 [Candidatus Adiutrix sp.]|jgi:hypothetical protein|nr:hypothetical protein [Candidatus Adiutrix sp.]
MPEKRSNSQNPDRPAEARAASAVDRRRPQGVILPVTMAAMAIMAFLGAVLLLNTRTEIQISGNTSQSRDAFTRADSATAIASQLLNVLLIASAGDYEIDSYLSDEAVTGPSGQLDSAYSIEFPNDADGQRRFGRTNLLTAFDRGSIKTRYASAGSGAVNDGSHKPDLLIYDRAGGQLVSTVAVTRDFREEMDMAGGSGHMAGTSIGIADSGSSGNPQPVTMSFAISVFGRQPSDRSSSSFFGISSPAEDVGPQSVLTVLYRAIFYY